MGNLIINELLHICISGINKTVDNICRLSPDLLEEAVSICSQIVCVCIYIKYPRRLKASYNLINEFIY